VCWQADQLVGIVDAKAAAVKAVAVRAAFVE